jgi:hypothetical protein
VHAMYVEGDFGVGGDDDGGCVIWRGWSRSTECERRIGREGGSGYHRDGAVEAEGFVLDSCISSGKVGYDKGWERRTPESMNAARRTC